MVKRISELVNQSISRDHAIPRAERMNRLSEKWEITKHTNIYIMGVPKMVERKRQKKIFKDIMAKKRGI